MFGRALLAGALTVGLLVLGGCGEEPRKPDKPAARSGLGNPTQTSGWLHLTDDLDPEKWLADRSPAARTEDPKIVRAALDAAAARFRESVRMIANRAVQLESMLAPLGGSDETAFTLVRRLTKVAGTSRHVEGFGSVGQQYYNLRKSGMSSDEAIADLEKHYGSHG